MSHFIDWCQKLRVSHLDCIQGLKALSDSAKAVLACQEHHRGCIQRPSGYKHRDEPVSKHRPLYTPRPDTVGVVMKADAETDSSKGRSP